MVVLASLREMGIDEMMGKDLMNFEDALGYLAAHDYAAEREAVLSTLNTDGIVTLDETAHQFPIALANAYLDTRQII